MIEFRCSLASPTVPLPHVWEHTVGSGHAPLALRSDYQEQLRRCHEELGVARVRFHALLSDDMGTVVCQDEKLLYSFFNTERIWDFLLSIGMQPFVELSFMPEALASGHAMVFHYRANITRPSKMAQWETFVGKLVSEWSRLYGADEVGKWYFEIWNEPNLHAFWRGTQEDYFSFYRATVGAIKQANPSALVGGPATAKNEWVDEFLGACERLHAPVDFVSTHHYPTDALGKIGSDTEAALARVPRGELARQARDASARTCGLPLLYTEWSLSSNPRDPLHDEPFAAAFITKAVLDVADVVEAYSYWTFSDIFEENYFPSCPFHGGFGMLNIYGIPKPAYRAFQLLHQLGNRRVVPVDGIHPTLDVWIIRGDGKLSVVLVNLAMPHQPIETEQVHLRLDELPRPISVAVERVDADHANAKRCWIEMGSPEPLNAAQVRELMEASKTHAEPIEWSHASETLHCMLALPPQALAV